MTKNQTAQMLPDLNRKRNTPELLDVILGCRVRLNSERQQILKQAYRRIRDSHEPPANAPIGGTSVRAVTSHSGPNFGKLTSVTVASIIGSRESIPLTTISNLQTALGVQVFSEEDILNACKNYIQHVFSTSKEIINGPS